VKLAEAMKLLEEVADEYEYRANTERVEGELVRALRFEDKALHLRMLERWLKSHEKELVL
jgi:hypothetical protein